MAVKISDEDWEIIEPAIHSEIAYLENMDTRQAAQDEADNIRGAMTRIEEISND